MVSKKNTLMPIKVKKLTFEKGHRKLLTDMSCEIKANLCYNYGSMPIAFAPFAIDFAPQRRRALNDSTTRQAHIGRQRNVTCLYSASRLKVCYLPTSPPSVLK